MQTLLLFSGMDESKNADTSKGLTRIESHFAPLWPQGWVRRSSDLPFGGMHMWDVDDHACLWPSWSEDRDAVVATLYVPLGYQRLIGDVPPGKSPQPLARALMEAPQGIVELTPPTVLARLDKRVPRLDLWTDALGIGRMFQLRTPKGWVWSNRPEVACLFAGIPARPDPMGWRYHAATSWFMGESSPIEGVRAVPAATHIAVSARGAHPVISQLDPSTVFSGSGQVDLEGVAEALRDTARSTIAIWPGIPTLDLTGGRDSRVVVAAFLSAGIDVRLHTHNAVPGEAEAAEHLVALLDQPVPHHIRQAANRRDGGARPMAAGEQVHGWHRYSGGLRPSSYLSHTPPATLPAPSMPVVGGAGGEVAHGFYYPSGVLKLETLPVTERLPAYRHHLTRRLLPLVGLTDAASAEATAQIDRVLRKGWSLGLSDAGLLDYFYADERLRRWGTTGERRGVISPLLTPAFVRAAFALRPQQRLDAALHTGVLEHLIPSWADVPFFKPTRRAPLTPAGRAPPAPVLAPFHLGLALDADLLDPVFSLPSRWAADMDRQVIQSLWSASRAGKSTPAEELVLWRVVWQDLYHDRLATTLGELSDPREAVGAPPPQSMTSPQLRVRDLIRRFARTRSGRALNRSRLGGALVDQLRRHGMTSS